MEKIYPVHDSFPADKCNFGIILMGTERMNRYFIELSFRGTQYHGWQLQPNALTVQYLLESALQKLTGHPISTTGAGRTDAGVHARFFMAHFDGNHSLFAQPALFIYKINCVLPPDISVMQIYQVDSRAHARFSALSRTYEYTISRTKDPFDTEYSWYLSRSLDITAMNRASAFLYEHNDFTSFSKLHTDVKTNQCKIMAADWNETGKKIKFRVTADRFLRNMVRALVGTLVDVGLGKISEEDFIGIISGKNRRLAGFSAPAHGLSLIDITYPEDIKII